MAVQGDVVQLKTTTMNLLIDYTTTSMKCDRDETIAFLAWNDKNGIFTDAQAEAEDMRPLSEVEAKLIAMRMLWENTPAPAGQHGYIVATMKQNGTDSWRAIRGDEANALTQATALYEDIVQNDNCSVAVLAQIIKSTDY